MTTGKTIALIRWTSVDKVISLLFNMLSRLIITFLPRSKHLLISWLQSPSAVILEPRKIDCFHCFPIYLPCPWKRRNSLGSVNLKVGTWATACSLLIQEAWPNHPRLASLPLKSCSYCNPDRRCFKILLWGQTNYFLPATKWNSS